MPIFQSLGGLMKMMIALLFVLIPSVVVAQDAPANFLYLRGGSSSAILANYTRTFDGDKLVWVGTLQDLTTDPAYREYQLGLGKAFGAHQLYALALYANDGWYLQIVGMPVVNWKTLNVSAFVAGYVPLQDGQSKQVLIDPATALIKVSEKWAVGASYTLYAADGFRKDAIGPTLQFALPKGSLNIDFLKGLRNYRSEIRATYTVAF